MNVLKSTVVLFARASGCKPKQQPVQPFREPIHWVDTACYVGVTPDTRQIWFPNIYQVRKRADQRLRMLDHLNRTGLSIINGVLLYKQLIHPVMDYACPIWRSAAHTHVRKLQVLQAKCICIGINALSYVGDKQIYKHLGDPLFANHTRAVIESFHYVSLY